MPAVFLDRLPLPSLQAYTAASIALLSCSIYYAVQVTSSLEWRLNMTQSVLEHNAEIFGNQSGSPDSSLDSLILENPFVRRVLEIFTFMIQEPLCIWTLINMAYCCLILIGKVIQKFVFGDLRVSEQQHIKDKFWNFVFYKFIFIFGVMNVQFMDDIVLWCSWFSVLGFLHLLAQLSKDRFEYLSFSPSTPKLTHIRLLMLLLGIIFISNSLFAICIFVGLHAGWNTFAFMAAECFLVTVRTLYVIARYAIHLWDTHHIGVWERRATYVYYTELFFELVALGTDFLHHLHMLLWGNIFLSMASLVICMQLRYLFYEIQRRAKKHNNYLRVIRHMETNYQMATHEELEDNSDDCAICWDSMEAARKLPCGHLFHNSCLRSWLEQDTSCPTCRMSLSEGQNLISQPGDRVDDGGATNRDPSSLLMMPTGFLNALGAADSGPDIGRRPNAANQTTNHFFHFDGSRYVSWFPSFSVEVTHTSLLGERPIPIQTSQLDTMARQVHQMFPHMPMGIITDDLRVTHSVEITVENILEERLVPPPSAMYHGAHGTSTHLKTSQEVMNASMGVQKDQNDKDVFSEHSHNSLYPTSVSAGSKCDSVTLTQKKSVLEEDKKSEATTRCEWNTETTFEDTSTARSMSLSGFRFSKSPHEREEMLARRKEHLIKMARRRYLNKDVS